MIRFLALLSLLFVPGLLGASTLSTVSFPPAYPRGASPQGNLILGTDGNFYGTTPRGGSYGYGTVFKLTPGGTLTTLYNFRLGAGTIATPGGLIQGSDGNFYGTASDGNITTNGGISQYGWVFKLTPGGTLTTLASVTSSNGGIPFTALIQGNDGNLYGTTNQGGTSGNGTVFKLTPSGTLTTLANFNSTYGSGPTGLIQANDGNFYGTTYPGTSYNSYGTVFKLTPGGTLTILSTGGYLSSLTQGSDGNLYGTALGGVFKLTLGGSFTGLGDFSSSGGNLNSVTQASDGNFYGTTSYGGSSSKGSVFKLTPTGTVTTLTSFNSSNGVDPNGLVQGSDGNFYGSTYSGGPNNVGTLFRVTPSGTLTTLYNFISSSGFEPLAGLVQGSDGALYGTTFRGGSSDYGTVFKAIPGGTITTLVNFNSTNGAYPQATLIQGSDGNFYGTTTQGGSSTAYGNPGEGTVFQLTPTGTLNTLANFDSTNGSYPNAGLIQASDGNFYGTTAEGGTNGGGTIFKLTPSGTINSLFSFGFAGGTGNEPEAGLVQGSNGNFYGTTWTGGPSNLGTAFQLTPGGSLTTLVNFISTNGGYPNKLIQGRDGNFYGTTSAGGLSVTGTFSGYGTAFQLTPTGTLTTLIYFNSTNGSSPNGLIQASDGNFYGTTSWGGSLAAGTLFQLTPTGTLTTLVNFDYDTSGVSPNPLIQGRDGNLYGVSTIGGSSGMGMVFSLNLSASQTVNFSSASSVPIVSSSYIINGSSLNLSLSYAPAPGTVLTVIQNTGTSPITGTFNNLPNGGTITASYGGVTYSFTANYAGGTDGQDLTLTLSNSTTSNPGTDTPTMPTWGLLILALGILMMTARHIKPHQSHQPSRP